MRETKENTRILVGIVLGVFTGLPFESVVGLGLGYCLITGTAIAFWVLLLEWTHTNNTLSVYEQLNKELRDEIRQLREENKRLKEQHSLPADWTGDLETYFKWLNATNPIEKK